MRVMVVHNEYRSAFPSGENRIVEDEIEGLRRAGVEVQPYLRSSDELESMSVRDRLGAALAPLTGGSSRKAFVDAAAAFRPDVVHLHNPYPLISPRLIMWCRQMGIPVVATIHNFRLRCINGQLYRDGAVCTLCESSATTLPGVVRGCYRESRPESALMGTALMVHRRAWSHVTRFIAVSEFIAERLESWGIKPAQIAVKVNPVDDPGPPVPPGTGFLFAGRLSEEKGIPLLLDAWERSGLADRERLVIAGVGPLEAFVRARAVDGSGIDFVGRLTAQGVASHRVSTASGVLCSRWFEAHGAVAESFSHQRAVVATRVGGLGRAVDESVGWLADPTVDDLARALVEATDRRELARRGRNARLRFEEKYVTEVVIERLVRIYREVMESQ